MKFRKMTICIFTFVLAVGFASAFTVHRDTLENGLVVLFSEAHKIPMVELRVIVKAGSVYDFPGKEGLANLTTRMLLRGTQLHSGDELIEKIEYLGANINTNTQEDYAELSGRALSKDLSLLLEIVSECLQKPAFNPAEFKKIQKRAYSEIMSQSDDPYYVGQIAFRKLLFGSHPLNHDPLGFDSTINEVDIDDLKNFYNMYYAPNNAILIAVGDFSVDSIKFLVEKYFSNWQRKKIPEFSFSRPRLENKKGIIINRDISQSYIFFGFFGPNNKAKDWIPTRLMNYILGGSGLTSRLATEIREKRGFAYDVSSFFDRFNNGGYFVAGVQTKNESANEAISLIVKEIERMSEDVSNEELARAKKYYTGNFPLNFDTYRELTNFITRIEVEELGLDYLDRFEKLISEVTLDDIKSSALKYLHPDKFCLAIVGNIDKASIELEDIEWAK
ncbi:MAG: pitrilysin family protein [candidate division WOR-3 bacterium]